MSLMDWLDIRYWRGSHVIKILFHDGKKALIEHLEKGKVGTRQLGFKEVEKGDKDITLIRHCWRNKNE